MPALHSFLIMALGQGALIFAAAWIFMRVQRRNGRRARIATMAKTAMALIAIDLVGGAIGAALKWGEPAALGRLGLGAILALAAALGSALLTVLWVSSD